MMNDFLCIDIGGSLCRRAYVGSDGWVRDKLTFPTPKDFSTLENQLIEWLPMEEGVRTLGISIAGAYIPKEERLWIPNAFHGQPLPDRKRLEQTLGTRVVVSDDRTAGAIGEGWMGMARTAQDYLYLIMGTGLGLGVVSGGRPIAGSHGLAGSIAWNRVSKEGIPLERILSGPGIVQQYQIATGIDLNDASSLFESDRVNTDANAKSVIEHFSEILGTLLGTLTNLLDPSLIVLAGSVSKQWSHFEERTRMALKTQLSPMLEAPNIVVSQLMDDACLLGMAKIQMMMVEP